VPNFKSVHHKSPKGPNVVTAGPSVPLPFESETEASEREPMLAVALRIDWCRTA
jgi:hypothetical protein